MARQFDYQDCVSTIFQILNEESQQVWQKAHLVKAVGGRMKNSNHIRINTILLALVHGKIVGATLFPSGKIRSVYAKTEDHSNDSAQVADLRHELRQANGRVGKAEGTAVEIATIAKEAMEAKEIEYAEKLKKASGNVVRVELKRPGKKTKVTKGLFHAEFKRILTLCKARMNVFIYGPTGCGKSHICEQIAESLDLSFSFVSCTSGMSEGVLGGRLLPTGKGGQFNYVISEFIKAYEKGGVFLLDEIDAADPNVLLLVNAALANGKVAVSNRPEKPIAVRHKDFICIAAANTVGTGADRLYSGRNKLDAATLDRFQIGKVVMGYDERVETDLCPDEELRTRLTGYRTAINAHRLERAMSTRFMRDSYVMKNEHEWDQSDIDAAFFSGWREDEINKVKEHVRQNS
jgi:MoxR-like ATPase